MSAELVGIYRAYGFVRYIIHQIYFQPEICVNALWTCAMEIAHNLFILTKKEKKLEEQVSEKFACGCL